MKATAGSWQAEVVVRRRDAFDARTAFRFETLAGGISGSSAPAPSLGDLLADEEIRRVVNYIRAFPE